MLLCLDGLVVRLHVSTLSIREGSMQTVVKKWGNSASVRIPATIMEAAQLSLDQAVDIREEGGRVIIERIKAPLFDLDDLLAGITDENLHAQVDFGPPVGGESL